MSLFRSSGLSIRTCMRYASRDMRADSSTVRAVPDSGRIMALNSKIETVTTEGETVDLRNLDEGTRAAMLSEVERDVASGVLYLSPRLSPRGIEDYPELLREAVLGGDAGTLMAALSSNGRLLTHETARHPKGGPDIIKTIPVTAAQTMAEGEFNRFYARGVCVRAMAEVGPSATVTIYRARESANQRSASIALIGTTPSAAELLQDLRTHIGMDTALGLPPGPNSGLSVHL